ncbi:MAG: glycoside hydrolase family 99-like domain-containing protein [Lachnospiraceae bacterium]|nr:glycoside hydrolase family 99-like domain-containing protein [Lachnospiraceae bacterium]
MKSKVLAIYLPQFHSIPENDKWWGIGFTEWTNVKRGKSFYPGHYQPRIPYHKNYYDLSDPSVLEKHIQMARDAKIAGFAFYHYYFTGKKLIEKPIENYRDHSKENFSYCLIWANQSWARTWYRANGEKEMLLEQVYGEEKEWREQFEYLYSFFEDERYIKIDNKPLYVIYLPQDIKKGKEMFELWNALAKEKGFDGLYLVAMNTGWGLDRTQNLYDAYMNFEPIQTICNDMSYRRQLQQIKREHVEKVHREKCNLTNRLFAQNAYTYSYLCKQIEQGYGVESMKKTYLGAFPGWDNSARKDEDSWIIRNSTPKRFGKHVERMLRCSEKLGNEYLFINAWNEWSEGAYLEPDERYGYAYLEELKRSIIRYEKDEISCNMGD